ncbi:glycoside hydrolase family 3 protein [uncultured Bacteroides sp.]|uniref:beta-glucosidase n=1 Tax=uncultured Bacteroides sp. TaxID=162156 RepID=UPI0026316754|nr:glycoside hydrolase family 3 C-terminal domain-containing protein [uncultured Bacteroides sp.]
MRNILLTTSLIALTYTSVYAERGKTPLYLDDTQPIELRIQDALKRMTLEEKTRLSYAQGKFSSPGCPRLGIPELWMSDGPHGVRAEINWNDWGYSGWTSDSCTAFPALTCLAATWNTSLSADYGKAIGEEALYRGKDVLLGPGVNIYRTPLNGRNFEYMGEDPYLASELCVPYIKGVQKNGVAACVKHYALNNQELWRGHIDVNISDRALREIYLPAFKAAVEKGKVWSIMGAYNKVRGVHATHNKLLNNDILKGEWKFDGCVITDWGAAHDTYEAAMYGLDIEMGSYTNGLTSESEFGYDDYYLGKNYLKMIKEGKIPMEVVDEKAGRVLRLIFRTAMNRKKGFGTIASESHYQTAYDVATEGIVLLKNEVLKDKRALLPIDPAKYEKILVVGDNATRNLMAGGGSSELKPKYISTPLDALTKQFGGKIEFAQGYMAGRPMYGNEEVVPECIADSLRNEAVAKARNSDLVIFIGGLNKNHFQDCEGGDRKSFALPFGQDKLITSLLEANKNVVVVIISGNAVEMPWVKKAPSIVQSWYLGSIGGISLRDVLTGKVNPSGKLPFSYPVKLEDCPAHHFGEMSYPGDSIKQEYKEDILVGYRWYDTKKIKPLYPFGYGMSYTTYSYSKPLASKKILKGSDSIQVSVKIKNTGLVKGKEIVQLYIEDEKCSLLRPKKELKGFHKVELEPNEEKTIQFNIDINDLTFFDDSKQKWIAEPGKFKAYIAASSEDIRGVVEFEYSNIE